LITEPFRLKAVLQTEMAVLQTERFQCIVQDVVINQLQIA
jgi:hypothetical protein